MTAAHQTADQTDMVTRAEHDPHRPLYHFVSPAGWLNDPNGVGTWDGRYHLFYQYNPAAPVHTDIHWGHASSTDLVHWRDEPIALSPSAGADEDGCWSGVLVNDAGTPTLVYSGNRAGQQRTSLAVGDPSLSTWHKDPGNPVIASPPEGLDLVEYRDHTVWREGNQWVQLMGTGIRGQGGAVLRYRSDDLRQWEFDGVHLADHDRDHDDLWTGQVWECPDFFPLHDTHVLLASAWAEGRTLHSFYYTGTYQDGAFVPARREWLDYGRRHFYAPQSFTDDHGRRVMFAWIQEARSESATQQAGWSGVMSLPRVLSLAAGGTLSQEPVPEISRLRGAMHRSDNLTVADGQRTMLEHRGDALDIEADLILGERATVTLWVRQTADGSQGTAIVLDAEVGTIAMDRSRSTIDETADTTRLSGHLPLGPDRKVRLRVLVDRSVIEVFANGRALTGRVYPAGETADHCSLDVQGAGTKVHSIRMWTMAGIWSHSRTTRP